MARGKHNRFDLGALNRSRAIPFCERYIPEPNSGCWLWTGPTNSGGYGAIKRDGKMLAAHRLSWEIHNGRSPGGMMVCHTCDIPLCVNPDHLFLGSAFDNVADKMSKGRHRVRRGAKHGSAKLSEQAALAIRSDTGSNVLLAEKYGVSQTLISHIKHRVAWRHLP